LKVAAEAARNHLQKQEKDVHDPDNDDGVITDLEPDIGNVKSSGP